jgi:hypothetical protein
MTDALALFLVLIVGALSAGGCVFGALWLIWRTSRPRREDAHRYGETE